MEKAICVFSSSSDVVGASYFEAARALGAAVARGGFTLVFGGTDFGLMGALARAAQEHGGRVIGVIPELAAGTPHVFAADEVIVTRDLRERKRTMEARADAFVGLPGGFGTLDELFDILTLKQLCFHSKPIVLLNTGGFFEPLVQLFEHLYSERFASGEHHRPLYTVVDEIADVFSYLDAYQPAAVPLKWF